MKLFKILCPPHITFSFWVHHPSCLFLLQWASQLKHPLPIFLKRSLYLHDVSNLFGISKWILRWLQKPPGHIHSHPSSWRIGRWGWGIGDRKAMWKRMGKSGSLRLKSDLIRLGSEPKWKLKLKSDVNILIPTALYVYFPPICSFSSFFYKFEFHCISRCGEWEAPQLFCSPTSWKYKMAADHMNCDN